MSVVGRGSLAIQAAIDGLGYDFNVFEITHFLKHLREWHPRPLKILYVPLLPELFGFWYQWNDVDYIFINNGLHRAHKIHCLLHEIAHLLLKHRGVDIRELLGDELCRELGIDPGQGHLRSAARSKASDDHQEQEAEAFVLEIQYRLLRARRLNELLGDTTSVDGMKPFVDALDFGS